MQEYRLFETKYWDVVLADEQSYLGRSVIILKRPCGELSELTSEEGNDFLVNVVKRFEPLLKKTFDATMFNWSCLMNNAYKEKDPQPQVHWHVRPRYNHDVIFAGRVFSDPDFGHHYNRDRKDFVDEKYLKFIVEKITKNLYSDI